MIETIAYQRGMFEQERQEGRIRFGTSVFHAYVHRWTCQLLWNPRLNVGWGFSDGEGGERNWGGHDSLVAPGRYSSSQRRVNGIGLRSDHLAAMLRHNACKPHSDPSHDLLG